MQRTKLNSHRVAFVAYDEDTSALHVWSDRGRHTVHRDVSPGVYENLATADPPDFYYNFYIAGDARDHRSMLGTVKKFGSVCALGVLLLLASASRTSNVAESDVASITQESISQ